MLNPLLPHFYRFVKENALKTAASALRDAYQVRKGHDVQVIDGGKQEQRQRRVRAAQRVNIRQRGDKPLNGLLTAISMRYTKDPTREAGPGIAAH